MALAGAFFAGALVATFLAGVFLAVAMVYFLGWLVTKIWCPHAQNQKRHEEGSHQPLLGCCLFGLLTGQLSHHLIDFFAVHANASRFAFSLNLNVSLRQEAASSLVKIPRVSS